MTSQTICSGLTREWARAILKRRGSLNSARSKPEPIPYLENLRRTLPKGWTADAEHIRRIAGQLDRVTSGEVDRLAIFMPPRHGKTESVTVRYPVYRMAQDRHLAALVTGYNERFARRLGRKARNVAKGLFGLAGDSQAADEWSTPEGGLFMTRGVGSPPTGTGFQLIIIDDPIRRREDAESEVYREKVWDWYTDDLYTRLEPGGAIILILCMAGDTQVLMEDGSEKPLRDIRPGDHIATYDGGKIAVSTVRNWTNQGPDKVFEIRMKSGITVKANARHPFLVETDRGPEWRRTDSIVKGNVIRRVIGASGRESLALRTGATIPPNAKGCACRTTISNDGRAAIGHLPSILWHSVKHVCGIVTRSIRQNMIGCLPSREAFALSANSARDPMCALTGAANSVSITAMRREPLEDFSATTATLPWATERPNTYCSPPLSMCEITGDTVIDVVDAGVEDVFDIEVDRTCNFIANGLVSHNTRWHEDDIAARALASEPGRWEVLSLPALAEDNDPLGRQPGQALWPARFDVTALARIRDVMAQNEGLRSWEALYQQNPTPREGLFFKVGQFQIVDAAPAGLRKVRAWDKASTAQGGDYTAGVLMGTDSKGRFWVLDVVRGQWSTDGRDAMIKLTAALDGKETAIRGAQDPGSAGKDDALAFSRLLAGFTVKTERVSGPKETRADPYSSQVNAGNVSLVAGPWNRAFIEEHRTFPQGKTDDQIDAAADAFSHLTGGPSAIRTASQHAPPPTDDEPAVVQSGSIMLTRIHS